MQETILLYLNVHFDFVNNMENNLLIIVGIRWINFSLETLKPFSNVIAKIQEQILMSKKQSNGIKKQTSDNKVSEKFWNFEMISFYVLPEKKAISLEECYPLYEQICLIPSGSWNFRYFLAHFLKNSPNTLDHTYITVNC